MTIAMTTTGCDEECITTFPLDDMYAESTSEDFYMNYRSGIGFAGDTDEAIAFTINTEENGQTVIKLITEYPDDVLNRLFIEPVPVFHPTTGYLLVIIAVMAMCLFSRNNSTKKKRNGRA